MDTINTFDEAFQNLDEAKFNGKMGERSQKTECQSFQAGLIS